MRRKHKVKISVRPKHLLYSLVFLCLLLLYVSYRYSDKLAPLKTSVGNLVTPMQDGINMVGTYITKQLELLKSKRALQEENQQLKAQIEDLKSQNSILIADGYELAQLRELYEVGKKYSDYPMIAASVISRDTNGYYSSFVVNKGSEDGIKKRYECNCRERSCRHCDRGG